MGAPIILILGESGAEPSTYYQNGILVHVSRGQARDKAPKKEILQERLILMYFRHAPSPDVTPKSWTDY